MVAYMSVDWMIRPLLWSTLSLKRLNLLLFGVSLALVTGEVLRYSKQG